MTSDRSLISRLVASLSSDLAIEFPILSSWDQEPKEMPFLVVSSEFAGSTHPRLQALDVRLELVTHRRDTEEWARAEMQELIYDHIEENAVAISTAMMEDQWQVRVWDLNDPISEEGEKDEWVSGYDYRVVVMRTI